MNRRAFLHTLAAAAPTFAWSRAPGQPASLPRRHVVIVGAGLSGLSAGLRLQEAGWEVSILEARARAGGRVHTLRAPFSDGLYAEAGAARIQDSHDYTLSYVKRFGLTLDPFWPTRGTTVTSVAGRRLLVPHGAAVDLAAVPLEFSPEERRLGLRGSLAKYLFGRLAAIGDPLASDWPRHDLSAFEQSIPAYAQRNGATPALARMIALGHDLSGMSALHLLRDTVVAAPTRAWFKIRGGNDRLPAALAAVLAERIRYGAPVVRLAQSDSGVDITCMRDRTPLTVRADYAICALPAAVMHRLQFAPELPASKRQALGDLGSLAMARVFVQTRRRFWSERGDTGWATTDDPMDVWDYTRDQPGPRGILGAYLSGQIARDVTAKEDVDRGRFVLERMEKVHPGLTENFETTASYSWIDDPWARGASAEFAPGQLSRFYQTLRAPVGRIYFAGEYTSPWSGWMNGALESGHRVADAILARHDSGLGFGRQ